MLQEHVDSILEGLPPNYHSIISVNEIKLGPLPIVEVEALFLAQETHMNKFHKQTLVDSPSIIYTQENPKSFSSHSSNSYTVQKELSTIRT